ncbi:hypothetical protein TorRG33x02_263790, partial [Trema orientale]
MLEKPKQNECRKLCLPCRNRKFLTLVGSSICLRSLSSGRQSIAMPRPSIAPNVHQSLHISLNAAPLKHKAHPHNTIHPFRGTTRQFPETFHTSIDISKLLSNN